MLSRIALILIVLIAVPYYWLLMDAGPTAAPIREIDLARLKAEAARLPGARPVALEYAVVAAHDSPGTALVAGGGLKAEAIGVIVWRLITPGGDTVINTGLTAAQARVRGYETFDPVQRAAADTWLRAARRIVVSDEDVDDIGGFVSDLSQTRSLVGKAIGNAAQIAAIRDLAPFLVGELPKPVAALSGPPGYAAIGPGIAAMRAPGHLPGSQLIYVQLQNGAELLFAGDTAPMRRSVAWLRPRSRYLAEWLGREDRAATTGWLKGLAALEARAPGLTIIFGSDLGWLVAPANAGRFKAATAPAMRKRAR